MIIFILTLPLWSSVVGGLQVLKVKITNYMDSKFFSQKSASGPEARMSCSDWVMFDPSEVTEQTKLLTVDTVTE